MTRTTIVVPCYNEERRLETEAFLRFAAENEAVDFAFVDDGSRDRTGERLKQLCLGAPERLRLISLPGNRGKGEAVREGVLQALAAGCDYVGYWDADLATPLAAILPCVRVLESRPGVTLVMGARVQLLGRSIVRRPARHYLGRVFATAVSTLLGLHVYDTQCGAKLFRVGPETEALFRDPFRAGWIFDVEVIARMIAYRRERELPPAQSAIVEQPLESWRDVAGSKLQVRHYLAAPLDLVRIWAAYLR